MTGEITAPWTSEQVDALNRFQQEANMHPFTCGALHSSGQSPVLQATHDGWVCPDSACKYTQEWAHAFMADPGAWPKFPFGERHGPTPEEMRAATATTELASLRREVAAARKFAAEMRDFCSPHGVSVGYADRLLEAMDRAKAADPGPPGTVRGTVPAEYVRLKGQLEADLRKMAACAAQPPKPGAEEVRAMQGGITAGICSSLARAIQCFEGPVARGAFLKRVEGDR